MVEMLTLKNVEVEVVLSLSLSGSAVRTAEGPDDQGWEKMMNCRIVKVHQALPPGAAEGPDNDKKERVSWALSFFLNSVGVTVIEFPRADVLSTQVAIYICVFVTDIHEKNSPSLIAGSTKLLWWLMMLVLTGLSYWRQLTPCRCARCCRCCYWWLCWQRLYWLWCRGGCNGCRGGRCESRGGGHFGSLPSQPLHILFS